MAERRLVEREGDSEEIECGASGVLEYECKEREMLTCLVRVFLLTSLVCSSQLLKFELLSGDPATRRTNNISLPSRPMPRMVGIVSECVHVWPLRGSFW